MNIKNERTQQLAREVAARAGESMTSAITVALEERLARLEATPPHRDRRTQRILAIGKDAGPRWKDPFRSQDHGDVLYDELGLPS